MLLEIFYEKVAEGSLASASMEIQVQGQISSLAGRLVGRDYFLYRSPVTRAKLEGKYQHLCHMCAVRSKHQTGKTVKKCTTMYCWKCNVGLYNWFSEACHKNLISVQCVNSSGCLVTILHDSSLKISTFGVTFQINVHIPFLVHDI
jgi:hypothetical protein